MTRGVLLEAGETVMATNGKIKKMYLLSYQAIRRRRKLIPSTGELGLEHAGVQFVWQAKPLEHAVRFAW